jgi:DNA processing protein
MNPSTIAVYPDDPNYPAGAACRIQSATLTCVGNVDLLNMKAIGICGSRSASDYALAWARRFGSEAAKKNLVVVSGHARGIDREAHKGALESGGCTIAVLPEGIDHFQLNRELKPYVQMNQNFLAVSMFPSDARWQVSRAMERNKLIVGLSSGMFVIEARDKGGTINAAMECVRQGKKLWAVAYSEDTPGRAGNRLLLQDAAIPLSKLKDVKYALDNAAQSPADDVGQLAMGLV